MSSEQQKRKSSGYSDPLCGESKTSGTSSARGSRRHKTPGILKLMLSSSLVTLMPQTPCARAPANRLPVRLRAVTFVACSQIGACVDLCDERPARNSPETARLGQLACTHRGHQA